MRKRIVTYDISECNGYNDFYDFLENHKCNKLTESTYEISTNMDFDTFCSAIRNVFHKGDNVWVITTGTDNVLLTKQIRG